MKAALTTTATDLARALRRLAEAEVLRAVAAEAEHGPPASGAPGQGHDGDLKAQGRKAGVAERPVRGSRR